MLEKPRDQRVMSSIDLITLKEDGGCASAEALMLVINEMHANEDVH